MPKCPDCGEEISILNYTEDRAVDMEMSKDIQGDIQYCEISSTDDVGWPQIKCPECGEVIFTDFVEAKKFLKGE